MRKRKKNYKIDEIRILDEMLCSLVELLEEKGFITREEWESRIKKRLEKFRELTDFNDLPE